MQLGKKTDFGKVLMQNLNALGTKALLITEKKREIFKFFDDTKKGDVIATRDFSANDGSSYTIFYDQNKNKVSEGKEIGKAREGEWKYYHKASKVLMTVENYKNGKLDGPRTIYYPNAQIAEEMTYKNGLKDGPYKKIGQDGTLLEESYFKNDEYNGETLFYDSDKSIASKGKFVNMSDPKNTNKASEKGGTPKK